MTEPLPSYRDFLKHKNEKEQRGNIGNDVNKFMELKNKYKENKSPATLALLKMMQKRLGKRNIKLGL